MKVQQPVMGVKTAQQVLDAERLAPDMLDVPFVVLVDRDMYKRQLSYLSRIGNERSSNDTEFNTR